MNATQWQRMQSLVTQALEYDVDERSSFLNDMCRDNADLRRQVDKLIESYEQVGNLLENVVGACAEAASSEGAPMTGQRIGPYQLGKVVGVGGMGTVYDAQRADDQFQQQVAIKIMHAGLGLATDALARFRAERQILANLIHPNIARLLDGGITRDNMPYLVMEYIKGTTVDRYATANKLSIKSRLELFGQICAAIQYAHQNLVVHRDIKPANVMVTKDGVPKLLDFGIAKLLDPNAIGQTVAWTRPAERLMTPEYASPEQIRGEIITTATDVYGLGALLYELLTGQRPFEVRNLSLPAIEHLVCDRAPERPSAVRNHRAAVNAEGPQEAIPQDLDNIVLKAMHKDPQRRYASAFELSEDIRRYLAGFPVLARTDSWSYRSRKFVLRHRWGSAAAALFLLTTTGLSIGLAVQAHRASLQAVRATSEAATAKQVSEFLYRLFVDAAPSVTGARNVSARELVDRGTERAMRDLTSQPLAQANLLQSLAEVYHEFGDLQESRDLAQRGYDIDVRNGAGETDDAVEALGQLMADDDALGDPQKAHDEGEKALALSVKLHGWKSDDTARLLGGLANGHLAGHEQEAESYTRQAIDIFTALHGADSPDTLREKGDLAVELTDREDYKDSEQVTREILQAGPRTLGPMNPLIGYSLKHLATDLYKQVKFQEAERYAGQGVEVIRKIFGPDHLEVGTALRVLGEVELELGKYKDAVRDDEEALAIVRKHVGPTAHFALLGENELGEAKLAMGDLKGAREAIEPSIAILEANKPVDKNLLASLYDHAGQLELAERHLPKAHDDLQRAMDLNRELGRTHSEAYAKCLVHLGEILLAEKKFSDAEAKFHDGAQLEQSIAGVPHPVTAEALLGLGNTLEAEGQTAPARKALEDALAMRRQILAPGSPDVVQAEQAIRNLGEKNFARNSASL